MKTTAKCLIMVSLLVAGMAFIGTQTAHARHRVYHVAPRHTHHVAPRYTHHVAPRYTHHVAPRYTHHRYVAPAVRVHVGGFSGVHVDIGGHGVSRGYGYSPYRSHSYHHGW